MWVWIGIIALIAIIFIVVIVVRNITKKSERNQYEQIVIFTSSDKEQLVVMLNDILLSLVGNEIISHLLFLIKTDSAKYTDLIDGAGYMLNFMKSAPPTIWESVGDEFADLFLPVLNILGKYIKKVVN